jgi:outer membrane protein TolC
MPVLESSRQAWIARLASVAGLAALSVQAAEPLDFADALRRLEARSPDLAAERQAVERSVAALDEARGRRWPTVALDGRVTRLDAPLTIDLDPVRRLLLALQPGLPPALLPSDIELQDRAFGTLNVDAAWPLYTGGRVGAGIDAAEAGLQAGQAALEQTQGELRMELVRRYFGQQLAERALAVRRVTVEGLRMHRDNAARLEREGQIARAERLRAEVALAEALRDSEEGARDLALAQAALAALLGEQQSVETATAMPELPPLPPLERVQERAMDGNPQLRRARLLQRQADAGVRAARGELGPTIALFGRRELYTAYLTVLDPEWAVGVLLNWPLFDGGQRRSRLSAAEARTEEARRRIEAGERDVALMVHKRHQTLSNAATRLASFEVTLDLARESLRAQRRAFEEGLASSLDVVDAELALSRVELGMLAARYEGLVALAGLYEATGDSAWFAAFASARIPAWQDQAVTSEESRDAG